ncbi:MAG TPA: FtsW/RodA/SpoVE family cell cycle protein [Solirubrobacteraceae bacterium]|jgi:rod shape determining protein RodA|nr:FtsW/RodA/SpoVE family cell cycle protein [Solirubrobacteraceae bacterium]
MSALSPIKPPEQAPAVSAPRTLRLPLDPLLTLAVLGLAIASVMTLGTATRETIPGQPNYYVDRQAIYLVIGSVLMLVLARVDYARFRPLKNGIYALLILSILAVLGVGHSAKGAQRAISLPFFSYQASELGKVLLILALSALVVDRARRLRERDTTARVMLAALVPAMLVIAQPDLGSGLVYMVIAFVMLLVAGTPARQLGGLVALVCVSLAIVLVAAPAVGIHALKPYQSERLTAFLHPSSNFQEIKEKESKTGEPDPAYQLAESKIAIGSGQKTGRGSDSTQLTGNYLPEGHTDFVFAAVGEQYGFVGAGLVLCLYALLIWRTLRILTMSRDLFGSLLAAGVAAMLMFQVFVNVGMTIGIMPITGVTLPLMSYGGSSVITTLLAVGLLQSIYVRARASTALKGRSVPLY